MPGEKKKMVAGFLAGIIAGLTAGILLAPKKGKEVREDIKKLSQKLVKGAVEKTEKFGKLTKAEYEKIVEEVSELLKKITKK